MCVVCFLCVFVYVCVCVCMCVCVDAHMRVGRCMRGWVHASVCCSGVRLSNLAFCYLFFFNDRLLTGSVICVHACVRVCVCVCLCVCSRVLAHMCLKLYVCVSIRVCQFEIFLD